MNKVRRKKLSILVDRLVQIQQDLEDISDEESNARDSIPENLMESDRYEAAEEACSNLESALDSVQDVMDYIEAAQE